MKKQISSLKSIFGTVALLVAMLTPNMSWGQYSGTGTFTKITSLTDLTDGYYVVAYGTTFAMSNTNAGTFFASTSITPVSSVITNPTAAIVWKIQTHADGGRTIYNEATSKYVSFTGTSNAAMAVASVTGGSERWTFAWSSTVFTVTNVTTTTRLLKYNTASPRFACYTTGQQDITLYKMPSSLTTPTLSPDIIANTVDNPIDITFTDDAAWRTAITAVKIGGTALTATTDYVITAGNIQLKPSGGNVLLTASGSKSVTVEANGYSAAPATQIINAGVPTANSTTSINLALAPNTSRTVTCTAKDQYNNLVSGYTFKYDASITNNNATTSESYTIDGTARTSTTNDVNVATATNVSGVATFTVAVPATLDGSDGISVQVQLSNGSTNIGSAFSYAQLASQTITFGTLSPVTYGDGTFAISATGGGSGNAVIFTSSNTAMATCTGTNGTTITIIAPGTCTIYADQAGNGSYNAAIQVGQSLLINKKELTVTGATGNNKVYSGTNAATISGTLSGVIGADVVTLNKTGTFATVDVATDIVVTSTSTLSGTDAAKYSLTQPTGLTADITKAAQTITFGALTNKTVNDADYAPGAISATSATNPISYTSSNLAVATIVANQIHIMGVGTTTITASQAASANYNAATDIPQSLTVTTGPILAWQFGSPASTGSEATFTATTINSNINTSSLSRGVGIMATGLARGFSANDWTPAATKATAVTNNDYYQFTVKAKVNYKASLSSLDATLRRTSTGPNAYIWKYSLDGTNFTEIGSDVSFTGTADGAAQTQINLSGISELQNVTNATTITFRLYAWGATDVSGTFAVARYAAGITTNCLAIGGTVECATPATPTTTLTQPTCAVQSGTITITAPTGVTYSIDGSDYSNNTGIFSGLAPNTYSVTAKNVCGAISAVASVTIDPIPATQWTGATNNEWSIGTNWCGGVAPSSSTDVIIPSGKSPQINSAVGSPAECNNLTIQSGGTLTINAGKALTAYGNTVIEGTFTVKADVSSAGSFISKGTVTGTANVERWVSIVNSNNGNTQRWEYISSPIASASSALFTTSIHGLRYVNEPTNTWVRIDNAAPQTMAIFKGYTRSYQSATNDGGNQAITYNGALNTGSQSIGLTYTAAAPGTNHGWNLVGNPYPSAIDWDAASGWTKSNIDGAIYFRKNGTACTYLKDAATGGASNIIPPMQAFWVRVSANSTLTCTDAVRVHVAIPAYKTTPENTLHLTVSTNGKSGLSDDTYIRFKDYATDVFDNSCDAFKMFAEDAAFPQIYTITGTDSLAINSLSALTSDRVIPLMFKSTAVGTFTLTAELVSSFANSGYYVFLKDKETGIIQNLSENPHYQFSTSTIKGNDRFEVQFKSNTTPLPIDLISFDAKCVNNQVALNWSTASEVNNDFFSIERSKDVLNWDLVEKIHGAGNSNHLINYSSKDVETTGGTSYYRLKQTDFDGKTVTYSPVTVTCADNSTQTSVSYFPNPFTSEVKVEVKNSTSETATVTIYDIFGTKVYTRVLNIDELGDKSIILNLSDLAAGVYGVEFRSATYSNISKIVKK
ncbi:MAG: YDG domain-containing protein [Bacteroidota bacterium]